MHFSNKRAYQCQAKLMKGQYPRHMIVKLLNVYEKGKNTVIRPKEKSDPRILYAAKQTFTGEQKGKALSDTPGLALFCYSS